MKILMVCLGNICRSPLAEGIMQHLADEQGLNWEVDSSGTGDWHVGECPDRRSISVARQHGVDISKQVCRLFHINDFEDFDQIYVMDKSNLRNVLALAPNAEAAKKVELLLGHKEVPDPYHDNNQFLPVFKMIEARCKQIIKELTNKGD
ncbi:low molecular weight protein-tyrosine-phosphatase [Mucilaginibacter sp. KACC 22063]|uniref:low molecular weight protein-tyrosine-phosphatase n=1 Tax=Mucilaginibacter sp. KACC 22063 TaxID=3025666 RepID=UPI002366EAD2|nr:low molecular weight protein-tyrosine-phosphatase [Mucilaginibacter sp. KACC 22063]WDF55501.1 low molecular weight phosphotyrosine protein phosphatase [Mucilaginibacter sp. KACC 22063]